MLTKPTAVRSTAKYLVTKSTRRGRCHWNQRIMDLLEKTGTALTTRQMAETFGCYPNNLTYPVLELRRAGEVVEAARGIEPVSGRKASYWMTAKAAKAAGKAKQQRA